MGQVRRGVGAAAAVAVVAVLGTSCSKAADFQEVEARGGKDVSLQTSTTMAAAASSGSSSKKSSSSKSSNLASTAQQLVAQLASDPQLLASITGLDPTQIAALTGLDAGALGQLQLNPATLRALGGMLAGMDPATVAALTSGAQLDPTVASKILSLAAQLDPAAAAAIKGIDPLAIATLIASATTVDPKVTSALGNLLQAVDPDGLGSLANDRSSLAILSILIGVAFRVDPSQFGNIANAANIDPNVQNVLGAIGGIVSGFTPEVVNSLNGLAKALGPDLLRALSGVMAVLGQPDVAPVIQAAANDPVVLITTLGTFALLIPGLGEVLAPEAFAANPLLRYALLAGLIGVAIANMNGLDLDAIAGQLGLPPVS